ncbi:hypothetical protein L210DRAFT_3525025, partial [Boletus edulis BED1]
MDIDHSIRIAPAPMAKVKSSIPTQIFAPVLARPPKNRVLAVDPHEGRCLIENCNPARAVKFAHCYPRHLTKDSARMTSLEYW